MRYMPGRTSRIGHFHSVNCQLSRTFSRSFRLKRRTDRFRPRAHWAALRRSSHVCAAFTGGKRQGKNQVNWRPSWGQEGGTGLSSFGGQGRTPYYPSVDNHRMRCIQRPVRRELSCDPRRTLSLQCALPSSKTSPLLPIKASDETFSPSLLSPSTFVGRRFRHNLPIAIKILSRSIVSSRIFEVPPAALGHHYPWFHR